MRLEHYRLARIEPREELSVHLLPIDGKHGLCGVPIWSERTVEPVDLSSYTIMEFLNGLRKGTIEVGNLTCSRCISALAIRARDS